MRRPFHDPTKAPASLSPDERVAPPMRFRRIDLSGRRCVVTGATSGLGEALARTFARWGAQVVIVARNEVKAHRTADVLRRESPVGVAPEIVLADLSQRQETRDAAETLASRGDPRPIHLLVNNAGIVNLHRQETRDGLEEVFATNYLAPFELTLRLLERLRASGTADAPARVVNVSSDMHRITRLPLNDLQSRRRYSWHQSYARSKLALVYLTRELARRLEGAGPRGTTRVTVNAVDPGPVRSAIAQRAPAYVARPTARIMRAFFPVPARAARTPIWLCTAPELAHRSGGYFRFGQERVPRVPEEGAVAPALLERSAALVHLPPALLPRPATIR